ncbi:MAG TPA: homoserine O-acetyltransferase [Phnomibacter sp.]|nr:homoserine O-acetyltransferase [Phnomibacter sp.]
MSEVQQLEEKVFVPCEIKTFRVPKDLCSPAEKLKWQGFTLESGIKLPEYHLAYTTCGKLNSSRSNVVWIFHALTANSQPQEWWEGLVGKGKLFDPEHHFIVCANVPGSCYGSISPLDTNAETGNPFYQDFPFFTTRDIIRSFQPLRHFLGIEKIEVGIGGSMGGQQLLEWAIEEPELFQHIIPIATNAFHSPWGIAFNTSQRMAIEADGTWKNKDPKAGEAGMKAARSLALISYRSYEGYGITQSDNASQRDVNNSGESTGGAASYQRYQGDKLAKRFNAFSYYALTKTMDSHNVGRGRESVVAALQRITARTLVIGIDSDVLFPLSEQHFLADQIPHASFTPISSQFGHDGFLLEFDTITKRIKAFLLNKKNLNSLKYV